ncbi:tetratricopeptide repeat protein [Leucobacter sp. W1478]|uniref:tetratricopeptide repeat protein n=1 Tax=Leucobacter sp. W1478 TaxID=3439065 RepID=UPI003F3AF9A9
MSQQIPERLPGGGIDLSHLAARGQGQAGPGASGNTQAGAAGQTVDVPALMFDVTEETLQQAAQLSMVVPVIVELSSNTAPDSATMGPVFEKLTKEFHGRFVVARVDVDTNPGLAQAFQVQAVPAAVALVGGRPVPLFQGQVSEEQVRDVLNQLLQLAAQQGVNGRVNAPEQSGDSSAPQEPAEPPVNPAHAEALAALGRGDFSAAVAAYEQVLLKAPADDEARAALVQVRLLDRLQGLSADTVRAEAATAPSDVAAQLRVADLDLSGGHVEDAFLRLLELFAASTESSERSVIRERLLELFEVVGVADPRVQAARTRLANLLY